MPVIDTSTLKQGEINSDTEFVYNGLDTTLCLEIFEEVSTLYNTPPDIYSFSRALQAPVLEMMCRGFRVDEYERRAAIVDIRELIDRLNRQLQIMSYAVWDKELNPRSPKQLLDFFYGRMRLPEIWSSVKGVRKLSMNMETLEKLEVYLHARPIIAHILRIRELSKMLSVLETEIDQDNRCRTSYNIGGTESGRFSSSANAFGTGCCLPSAEALTREGWKRLDEIVDGTEIAQYAKGEISFVPCTMYKTSGHGKLLNVKSEQYNLTMTEQHRMLHFSVEGGFSYTVPAIERSQRSVSYIPIGGKLTEGTVEYPAYLAMLMADWSKEGTQWRASFKKKRKVDRFLQLATQYAIPFKEGSTIREGYARFAIHGSDVSLTWPKKWGSWILDLTPKCRKELLEEARHWDSHDRGSGFIFYSADKEQAEWFAILAHLCNRGATIRQTEQSEGSYSDTTMWCVNVKNKNYCSIQKKHWTQVEYAGDVYCPQVPSSYWLVRDNGFISITGNTNLQNLRQDPDWKQDDGRYKISLRKIFVADPGYKICGIDLEQAESREVGWQLGLLFDDWSYLDACEAGDLHTATCMLIWQDLSWTTDPKANRQIADANFYRQFSYRDMSKRGGHGCLTAEHEVLTKNGWVPISSKPQEILTWSQHGKSFFAPVSNWLDKDWEGQLVSIRGAAISVDATEDHKLIYRTNEQNGWRNTSFGKIPKSYIVPLGDNYVGGNEDVTPDIARLIAAFQADGTQASIGVINFRFQKLRKKMRIEMLAINAGINHKVTPTGAYIYASNWPKNAGAYLLNWPKEALEAYTDEHKHWDGHIDKVGKIHISSVNKEHLEWIRTIGRLVGTGGYLDKPHTSGHGSTIWRISQNNRKYAAGRQIEVTKQQMSCRVYCPTVSTGAFYVRHNGKISITGNSNYLGSPFTMARHLKVPTKLLEDFQHAYFRAFPIPRWHTWTAGQIQTIQQLTTPFGRRRHFFGRPNDDTTLREAVAYVPQSATADRMNLALWRMWYYMGKRIQLLAQVHDAVYFQFPETAEPTAIISEAISYLSTPFLHTRPNGQVRKFDVPGEAKVGWNWGNYHEKHNPDGLQKWKGQDDRKRSGSGLQRVM